MLAVVPLRGFGSAKTRLAAELAAPQRAMLAAAVAERVIGACGAAGWEVLVVSGADDVISWSRDRRLRLVADPGTGLDGAATVGVAAAGEGPWAVIHGDLPLLGAGDLDDLGEPAAQGTIVLAPSRDGGTNLIAGRGAFPFAYGPGSFARHLARVGPRPRRIIVRVGLAVELDTPADLGAARAQRDGRWLSRFLS